MRFKNLVTLLVFAAFVSGLFVMAQQPDDEVRGAFLSSRPKNTNSSTSSRRHKPLRTHTAANNKAGESSSSRTDNSAGKQTNADNKTSSSAIGLGYTLFMADAGGNAVRVEPSREFHNGDRIRISLEPNLDGYMYVFHRENDGPPEMLYPDARLESGDNAIEAHVPFEVPSREETNERMRWFTFYGNGGTERLYLVVTRGLLKSVPTGNDLIAFCAAKDNKCPWHPSAESWAQIQDAMKAEVKVVTSKTYGQPETDKEKDATTRGLGLDQSAPEPSVIRMSASTNAPVLVTVLDLVHK